jgi:hypothetical protein
MNQMNPFRENERALGSLIKTSRLACGTIGLVVGGRNNELKRLVSALGLKLADRFGFCARVVSFRLVHYHYSKTRHDENNNSKNNTKVQNQTGTD